MVIFNYYTVTGFYTYIVWQVFYCVLTYMFFAPKDDVLGTTKAALPKPLETENGRLSMLIRKELGWERSQKFIPTCIGLARSSIVYY